ncbi:glycerol-3-phosphate transporter [Rodentibacter pneumotropicus]|uniref:Glycerol-3-phosphate transporter n=1 Tax=Rodentibacter pneumotropicus TaxID=758 RepID=A0A448MID0_9PAST|nr:glycerol-3-phosphate transporter [Rodentibacter pneumotropicus]
MGDIRHRYHVDYDFLNGWFQGMGWPPCGRTMVHWWSKSERGTIVSIWNTAHNLGGMVPGAMVLLAGAIYFSTYGVEATAKDVWQQALYYPGIAAMIIAIPIYLVMKDTHNLAVYHLLKNGVMTIPMTITKKLTSMSFLPKKSL